MEYTTDETETPMSTQGTSRITREFTDKKKINKAQDSLLLFMPAITFQSSEPCPVSLLDLVRCLMKSFCNSRCSDLKAFYFFSEYSPMYRPLEDTEGDKEKGRKTENQKKEFRERGRKEKQR